MFLFLQDIQITEGSEPDRAIEKNLGAQFALQ